MTEVGPAYGTLIPRDEMYCELQVGTDSLEELAGWLGTYKVEVLEPHELRSHMGRLARRYARAAGGGAR